MRHVVNLNGFRGIWICSEEFAIVGLTPACPACIIRNYILLLPDWIIINLILLTEIIEDQSNE